MTSIYSILLIATSVLRDFKIIEGWVNPLVNQIKSQLEPYQVTIFTNSEINSVWDTGRYEIQRILADIPMVAVDLGLLESSSKENLMSLPTLRQPRKVSLHVILHYVTKSDNEDLSKHLWDFFDIFVEASDIPRRPKCLMIIFIDDLVETNELLRNITEYAWTKKFLDLTILVVDVADLKSRPYLFNYNPFKNTYEHQLWDPNKTTLFPDKLRDMNNYTLRTTVFNYPPYLIIDSDNNSTRPNMDGIYYPLMSILSSYLNFTMLSIGELGNSRTLVLVETLYNLTSTGAVNLLPFPVAVETFARFGGLELSSFFGCYDVAAIVPLHRDSDTDLSSQIYLLILSGTMLIFFLHILARLLRFDRRFWRHDYIVRIIFTFSSPAVPKRLAERLLFLIVSTMAMQHSSNFLMQLVDVRIERKPPVLDNFYNIKQSRMPIFVDEVMEQTFFSDDNSDKLVRFLHNKAIKQPNMINCIDKIKNNRSVICLTDLYLAKFFTKNTSNKTQVLKIRDPLFYCRPLACTFEKGSPYVEKFSEVVQSVTESGIQSMWKCIKELETKFVKASNKLEDKKERSMLLVILLVCLSTGFGTAGLILLGELLCRPKARARKRGFGAKTVTFEV
ncbi:hypothetical protein TSAR_004147 [Trichomalopsis sarcophagae]|uniref:Ionotropic glutamate receptor C-terminal domain-containing protein n=1 Tax=Trichomalopsis sarcophagae TaxID=543379 RepID=A0A232F123_9HYME|nr:hypothetical protein TSAR_004147 [Trichomalopsis sarcophagae]